MRLICGVFHLDGRPADPHRLARMLDALRPASVASHRAVHVEGAVALGRLSVRAADEGARLPRAPGGLVLAADSRLDATGPGSPGDDAPLLAALDSPESGALGRLLGDFAVAAWDPGQGRLTCTRDGMGIRPLYYVHRPGDVFAVASRPAALLAGGFAAPDLDLTFIARTLMWAECGPDLSLFTGIRRVAPGTSLRVTRGRLETRVEWRLSADLIGRGPAEPEEAAAELRRLVAEAVRCRLPAQGPVATDLSGGLDSSSITLLAADAMGDPGRVVAASFLPRDADPTDAETEWPYVNAVRARLPGLDWAPIHAAEGFAFLRPEMGRDHLRPVDPAGAPIQTIARARARGADRLLSGWGGDEGASFNGRGVFAEALVRGRWRYLAAELPPYAAARDIGVWRAARGEILPHLIGARTLHGLRRLAGRPDTSPAGSGIARMLAPHLRASAGSPPPLSRCRSGAVRLALLGGPGIGRRCEESNLLGADHGVSLLFPMLDRRVVEFALSLPGDLFLREGKRRWIYRRAMADLLPERIAERRTKLMPIQNTAEIIRAGAGEAARWIGGLVDDPRLTACLDTAAILREVTDLAATPPEVPIDARLGIKNVLHVAAFLEQHG